MSEQKVVLLAAQKPFAKDAVEKIQEVAVAGNIKLVLLESYKSEDDLVKAVADVDALIVRSDPVNEKVLSGANKLKLVVRAGAGFDTIDLAACTKHGVIVMNTPGQNSNAVAELVFGLLIFLQRVGFSGKMGTELRGRRLGLQGFGYVARCVREIAAGFGMEVSSYDPLVDPAMMEKLNVRPVKTLLELYSTSDIVSIHCPLLPETKGSVGVELLNSMKRPATLINTARAEVVDEAALKAILLERPDFKFGADVPPKCAQELKEKYPDRIIFTGAKSGAQTEEANNKCGIAAVHQIINFFLNGDVKFQVNK